ncbi:ATP-binding protein [Roseateles sp.]|uniref:ATP-binding protein n=1 Tax=Roseateles sp. TaxID=1971397 RepID=UPI0025F3953F|nr:ATP-binding protein [Roseateles sp.]MBV8035543.1 AAA family ATPase [Roseateles sp.]
MSVERFPIVYLTGAPATGKSTVCSELSKQLPELLVFSYSAELRKYAERRTGQSMSEDDIRRLSGVAITPEDVQGLDVELAELAARRRDAGPMIIDSHAVTKEVYGFRVTAFDTATLSAVNPDCIVCLYTLPEVACQRIASDPRGRPQISAFEAGMHTQLQCSVAAQYGVLLGKPVYLVDSSEPLERVVAHVAAKARLI